MISDTSDMAQNSSSIEVHAITTRFDIAQLFSYYSQFSLSVCMRSLSDARQRLQMCGTVKWSDDVTEKESYKVVHKTFMLSTAWMCVRVDSMALCFYRSSLSSCMFLGARLSMLLCDGAQILSCYLVATKTWVKYGGRLSWKSLINVSVFFYTHFYFDSHISHSRRKWMRFFYEFGSCASRTRFLTETFMRGTSISLDNN